VRRKDSGPDSFYRTALKKVAASRPFGRTGLSAGPMAVGLAGAHNGRHVTLNTLADS